MGIVLLILAFSVYLVEMCPNTLILGGIKSAILGILYTEAWFKSVQLAWLYPFNPVTFPADKPYWQRLKRKANFPQTPFPHTNSVPTQFRNAHRDAQDLNFKWQHPKMCCVVLVRLLNRLLCSSIYDDILDSQSARSIL